MLDFLTTWDDTPEGVRDIFKFIVSQKPFNREALQELINQGYVVEDVNTAAQLLVAAAKYDSGLVEIVKQWDATIDEVSQGKALETPEEDPLVETINEWLDEIPVGEGEYGEGFSDGQQEVLQYALEVVENNSEGAEAELTAAAEEYLNMLDAEDLSEADLGFYEGASETLIALLEQFNKET